MSVVDISDRDFFQLGSADNCIIIDGDTIILGNETTSTRPSRKGGGMIEEARKVLGEARAAMDTEVEGGQSAPKK